MADWNDPLLTTAYADLLAALKARDDNCAILDYTDVTNIPTGAIRYVVATNKFQRWDGSEWADIILSPAGGGTGNPTVGSMVTQAADDIDISGGEIAGTTQSSGIITPGVDIRLPSVSVYHNATQTFVQPGYLWLAFNSEWKDTSGFHDVAVNNSRLTVPTGLGGFYMIGGSAYLSSSGDTGGYTRLEIKKNDTTIIGEHDFTDTAGSIGGADSIMTMAHLADNDFVRLRFSCGGTGTGSIWVVQESSPKFWMVRVGD